MAVLAHSNITAALVCRNGFHAVPIVRRSSIYRPQLRASVSEGTVSAEDAHRFEQIAAALVEKLKDLPEDELEPAGPSAAAIQAQAHKSRLFTQAVLQSVCLLVLHSYGHTMLWTGLQSS
jgi:hypothetical protein